MLQFPLHKLPVEDAINYYSGGLYVYEDGTHPPKLVSISEISRRKVRLVLYEHGSEEGMTSISLEEATNQLTIPEVPFSWQPAQVSGRYGISRPQTFNVALNFARLSERRRFKGLALNGNLSPRYLSPRNLHAPTSAWITHQLRSFQNLVLGNLSPKQISQDKAVRIISEQLGSKDSEGRYYLSVPLTRKWAACLNHEAGFVNMHYKNRYIGKVDLVKDPSVVALASEQHNHFAPSMRRSIGFTIAS